MEGNEASISSKQAMRHVRAYCNAVSWQPDKVYGRALSTKERIVYYLLRLVRPLWHPLKRIGEVFRLTAKVGEPVAEASGVSKTRQFVQQLALYVRHGVRPKDYYQYMLYREDMRREAGMFIYHVQMSRLMNTLAEDISSGDAEIIRDKVRFWRHCQENDLATIPIYAVVDGQNTRWLDPNMNGCLPTCNLFSKPADWGQGLGIKTWEHIEASTYRDVIGAQISSDVLIERLQAQSQKLKRRIIVQPQVKNSADLEELVGSSSLCSARIITIRKPQGKAEFLVAMAGLPAGKGGGSNFSTGALGAPVDGTSGVLGKARYKQLSRVMESYENHPSTGRLIAGFKLPDWDEAVNLAVAAHESFPCIAFVGWDVAFTNYGPILIEGNVGFGANSPQITHGVPLGRSKLPLYHRLHTKSNQNGHECNEHHSSSGHRIAETR
jgi:hypothetical protein